jgi:hypothetical protein
VIEGSRVAWCNMGLLTVYGTNTPVSCCIVGMRVMATRGTYRGCGSIRAGGSTGRGERRVPRGGACAWCEQALGWNLGTMVLPSVVCGDRQSCML